MSTRLGPFLVALFLSLRAVLPPPAAAAVARLPTSQAIAASSVPARGAAPAHARSYFGARYLRADLGRFTTIDPVYTWTENLVDPQRWNRYSYVRNNPLRWVDPDGRASAEPWEPDEHARLTTGAVGALPANDAPLVVAANRNVDRTSNQFNSAAHYVPSAKDQAERLIESRLADAVTAERASQKAEKPADRDRLHAEAMAALGEGLHTLQDRSAHGGLATGSIGIWWAHRGAPVGRGPDSPTRQRDNFLRAFADSRDYVKRFVAQTSGR